jgi:hypothetical protein
MKLHVATESRIELSQTHSKIRGGRACLSFVTNVAASFTYTHAFGDPQQPVGFDIVLRDRASPRLRAVIIAAIASWLPALATCDDYHKILTTITGLFSFVRSSTRPQRLLQCHCSLLDSSLLSRSRLAPRQSHQSWAPCSSSAPSCTFPTSENL